MSELIDCINNLSAENILRGATKKGPPFYIKTIGLSVDPCEDYINLVSNSGGEVDGNLCDTDWLDDNSDGVANNWAQQTGAGACSIVTGNGFYGNAQRMNHVNGTLSQLQYFIDDGVTLGNTYNLSLKYRSDDASVRIYLRGSADAFILGLPANPGNAIEYSGSVVATASADLRLNFYILPGRPNCFIEVDEVRLWTE